jgi:tRNA (cmo5U34)-methyltransferase
MSSESSHRPEKMGAFFDERATGYDAHMLRSVASFEAFYAAIAQPIAQTQALLHILDIGCGTGLELDPIFERAPNARVTGIDLSEAMLAALREKYATRMDQITLIQGSYLAIPFEESSYDYAVSVMTLHHLLPARKALLYAKIRRALNPRGSYIEGDYVVSKVEEERLTNAFRQKVDSAGLLVEAGAYHVDIPLALETQRALLLEAGFAGVEVIWHEGEAAVYVAHA